MTLVNSLENNFEQPNTRVAEPFPLCLERPLGAVVSQSGTQFAIWAPTAEKITLRLFSRGSKGEDGDALIGQFLMRPEADGSWTYDFADNKHGLYYDFLIERDCRSMGARGWRERPSKHGRRLASHRSRRLGCRSHAGSADCANGCLGNACRRFQQRSRGRIPRIPSWKISCVHRPGNDVGRSS